jgi:alkanesulfonate monooxygenase SsuD/methylene tetrahydromethanopterin reductase-like flavin-dependent oxidoreductase (luciferase family)
MTSLGAIVLPSVPPERFREVVEAAEQAGLPELWLWEDCFDAGALTLASAALAWTQSLRVGVGILPTPLRAVALTAMELSGLARLHPGRLGVGVGHGVQDWMGQAGVRASSPVTLLREYTSALRELLAGREVTTAGDYVRLDGVCLGWPPDPVPAVLAGATGPRTMRVTGEVADGTVLAAGITPDDVPRQRALVDEGRASAGRPGHHQVVVYVMAALGEDAAARLEAEQRSWGLEPLTGMGLAGSPAAVADGVRRWFDAGADTVVLQPMKGDDPIEYVRLVGSAVRPLLG